ncbi:MAG: S24/S26 family peptidase, partial [Anaerolineales bacterium]
ALCPSIGARLSSLVIFKIVRIQGDSMSPEFQAGDFVVISKIPRFTRIKCGDEIVFHHPQFGVMIKKVQGFEKQNQTYWVGGINPRSIDSQRIGPIKDGQILGKVIWHIRPK